MHKMEAQVLEQLLEHLKKTPQSQLPSKFISFFNIPHKGHTQNLKCSLEDFAIYYLAALRQHTDLYFRINETETPKASTPIKQPQSRIATTTTPAAPTNDPNESLGHHSINSSSSSSICTPGRNQQHPRRSTFSSTPHSNNRSGGGGGGGNNSLCLGDFLVNTPNQSHQHQQRSKKKTTPQQQQQQGTPSSSSSSQAQQQQAKPRRRVLPMTISKNVSANSSFGDTSSFSNDNNLWRLSQNSELLDRSQGAALELETRQTLILKRHEIRNEAPVSGGLVDRPLEIANASAEGGSKQATNEIFDLNGLHNPKQLELLATIYEQLINLNLVPNVLGELGYQLQLLNNIHDVSNEGIYQKDLDSSSSSPMGRLTCHKDCIYFVLRLLEYQTKLLMQLDRKSLSVLLQQERLSLLPKDLLMKLELTCQQKQENFKNNTESNARITNQQQNVYYHQEKDSRDNFPTQNEFGAFKAQRDLFYKCLKYWELSHLNRIFNFKSEMTHKIREIFDASEHAVNMAHFAKLFVSQLIISASETTESPEELGLKLDQLRLNRLAQRLVTSNSSVEDQFPRSQSFFRDFINECGSLAFIEQLKLALYAQLMRYNDSTFEMVQMQQNQEEDQPPSTQQGPFIVRPQILANMLILAKFLGYIMALPFNQSNSSSQSAQSTFVCPQQLQLRSHFQPNFNLLRILEHSIGQGKILITLPWLVQYLVMLDIVTLQLPDILATLDLLYALYAKATPMDNIQSEAVFIIRSSIGWLMEAQPQLVNSYYTYRSSGSCVGVSLVDNCIRGLLQTVNKSKSQRLPMMEELLTVACPSLNEFRVTITTCRPTQSTSRSGRYRYITTRLEQLNQSNSVSPSSLSSTSHLPGHGQRVVLNADDLQQRQLQEAFLHSQNASMRRLIEFVTERSFKCVVKDAQMNILLPSKASADGQVNEITSTHTQEVLKNLQQIYQTTRLQACQRWAEEVPHMLDQRIEQSLQALLPANTNATVQLSYSHIIRATAQPQLQQWLQSSVMQSNFYHGDLHELANKICRSNKNKLHTGETGNGTGTGTSSGSSGEMCLSPDPSLSLSELLYDMQQWLHCLSLKPANNLRYCLNLSVLIQRARQGSRLSKLPIVFYQLIGSGMVRLNQLLICKQPQLLSQEILSNTCDIWQAPQMAECCKSSPGIFDDLLSVTFIQELDSTPGRYQLLEKLLLAMLDRGIVNANELNEMIMPLFKENWPTAIWTELSRLLQQLSLSSKNTSMSTAEDGDRSTSPEDDAKSHLFMEMLADLSRDLDSF